MFDLLLKHAYVITMDEKRRLIEDGAVGIENGKIAFVGESREAEYFQAKEVLDLKNHVVMPGFVDARKELKNYKKTFFGGKWVRR